VLSFTG